MNYLYGEDNEDRRMPQTPHLIWLQKQKGYFAIMNRIKKIEKKYTNILMAIIHSIPNRIQRLNFLKDVINVFMNIYSIVNFF